MNAFIRLLLSALCLLVPITFSGCAGEPEADAPTEPAGPTKPQPGDYVTIPAGEFIMGSDERPENAKDQPALYEPEHTVELPAYQISAYEVTNADFARFQLESEYRAEGDWRRYYNIGLEDRPVANVTYQDAVEYCKWAGGRLPTEQEWEKAGRGEDGFLYPWGNDYVVGNANTNDAGYGSTVDVGQVEEDVSPYGVYDMFGNVTEWMANELKPYPNSPARRDPNFTKGYIAARGASYAIRGSSFFLYTRGAYVKKSQYGLGFRCVKDIPGAEEQETN